MRLYIRENYTDFSSMVTKESIKKSEITMRGKNGLPWSINRARAAQYLKSDVSGIYIIEKEQNAAVLVY